MTSLALPPVPANTASPVRRLPLGELLVEAGIVTPSELEIAIGQHTTKKVRLGETLLEMGFVDEATLLQFLSRQMDCPCVRLREGLVDPMVVRMLSRAKATALCSLVMFRVRDEISVAMAEPGNLEAVDEIERVTGLRVRPVLALRSNIEAILPRCYEDDFSVDAVTADLAHDAVELQSDVIDINLGDVESLADGSPIVNLVNFVIVNALRQKASDIHIEPGHRYTTIRLRVDGQLREVVRPRKDFHAALVSRLKVMAKLDIAEHRVPQDGRMHVLVEGRDVDLRISTLPTILGEKVVMRLLDRRNVTFNLDELGVPAPSLAKVKSMLAKPHGLILVTGPTGSGKTTTLYSALELIKSVATNVVTVEDPVEYQLELINQVQVGANRGISFASALRAILRQDPDVIMVGEIRDAETATVAIQAALTGHLVLSTLHTNDTFSAITRLRDMGVESFKIAAALVGVIAQRLIRTVCPQCKTSYYPTPEVLASVQYNGDIRRQFVRGEGCRACYDTGFRGRVGVYEVLAADREMKELISSVAQIEDLKSEHLRKNGALLRDHGIEIAEAGLTSLEEVARVVYCD
jgi:type IV pilus assembly protein PilB